MRVPALMAALLTLSACTSIGAAGDSAWLRRARGL